MLALEKHKAWDCMLQAALKVEGGCNQRWMLDRARDITASNAEKLLAVDLDEEQVCPNAAFALHKAAALDRVTCANLHRMQG